MLDRNFLILEVHGQNGHADICRLADGLPSFSEDGGSVSTLEK